MSIAFALAALVWSAGAGVTIWTTPIRYSGVSGFASSDTPPTVVETETFKSFAEASRLGAVPLLIPVVLTALGVWCAWRRFRRTLVALTVTLLLYAFVAGFSIGGAYLPAVAALLLATLASFAARSDSTLG